VQSISSRTAGEKEVFIFFSTNLFKKRESTNLSAILDEKTTTTTTVKGLFSNPISHSLLLQQLYNFIFFLFLEQ